MSELIRPAVTEDAEALHAIEAQADALLISSLGAPDWPPAGDGGARLAAPGFVLVLEDPSGSSPVGFVHVVQGLTTSAKDWRQRRIDATIAQRFHEQILRANHGKLHFGECKTSASRRSKREKSWRSDFKRSSAVYLNNRSKNRGGRVRFQLL